jgi:hypothetical protein
MKRSFDQLERNGLARAQDDVRRGARKRDDAAARREETKKDKELKFASKWRSNLERWDAMGLVPRTGVGLPGLVPATGLPRRPRILLNLVGGVINLAELPRRPSPLDCLNAVITRDMWSSIQRETNSRLAMTLSQGLLSRPGSYHLVSIEELHSIFFGRLDIICRNVRRIEQAFTQVLSPQFAVGHFSQSLFFRTSQFGTLTDIDFSISMAIFAVTCLPLLKALEMP